MSPSNVEINPFTTKAYSANYFVLRKTAQDLPVSQQLPQLLSTIKQHNIVVVVGETGTGKTTQLPKALLLDDEFRKSGKKIALTQNRRLAAQLVANRIAEEMDVRVGTVVGLKHRGCDLTNHATRLEVVTDGSLLAAAKSDVDLSKYGAIVIDEAHQHTVPTDLLLGLLKELAARRTDDLKIIIMSATIDADLFLKFLPGSVLETVRGRPHKVSVSYLAEPPTDDTIIETILQVHLTGRNGNILVFVSGVREIHQIIEKVQKALNGPTAPFDPLEIGPLECWPLHATLSPEAQDDAVETISPAPQNGLLGRKLLIATNIAETSVTLTGVTHVIDSCKAKSKIWNPRNESWCLREQWISKAVARQRAGRAGRTRDGMAYRMCTEGGFHEQMMEHSVPAIMEGDMLSECLSILKMGLSPLTFPYIVAPATETVVKALEILHLLGAVDARGRLTTLGKDITSLPVDVYSAFVLLESPRFGCSDEMISLVSMMEATDGGSNLFSNPSDAEERAAIKTIREQFRHGSGDHITLFNIYMAWRAARTTNRADDFLSKNKLKGSVLRYADQIRLQLLCTLLKVKNWQLNALDATNPGYHVQMLKALAAGNHLRIAKRESSEDPKSFVTVRHGAPAKLTADTNLGAASRGNEWVIYNEFHSDGISKHTLRLVSAIVPELFISARPDYWWDTEFLPEEGQIRDQLVKIIAGMTGNTEDFVRGGGMSKNPTGGQS